MLIMAEALSETIPGKAAIHLVGCDHVPELGAEIGAAMGDSEVLAFEDVGVTPEEREFSWKLLNTILLPELAADMSDYERAEMEIWAGIFSSAAGAVWHHRGSGRRAELVDMLADDPEFPIVAASLQVLVEQDEAMDVVQPVSELLRLKDAQTRADLASNTVREKKVAGEIIALSTWDEGYNPRRVSVAVGAGHMAMLKVALVDSQFEVTTAAVGPSTTYKSYDARLRDQLRSEPDVPFDSALLHRSVLLDICYAMHVKANPPTPLEQSLLRKNIHTAIEQMDDEAVLAACAKWDALAASTEPVYLKHTQARELVSFELPELPDIYGD
jgi:hypothetical protein